MATDKAYKLLAKQEKISNRAAKELIDKGLVYSSGKKVLIARGDISTTSKFKIQDIDKIKVIFEDENIIAVNKPAFLTSEEISVKLNTPLLHRLDRETSGVLLLVKNEDFAKKAIKAFKNFEVNKEYVAWCDGRIFENMTINEPILTIKNKNTTISKISENGKEAVTLIEPLLVLGKASKIKAKIITGRTHQIRVHLKSIGHSIFGDVKYSGKPFNRVMLHAFKIELLGYSFEAKEPRDFIDFEKIYD